MIWIPYIVIFFAEKFIFYLKFSIFELYLMPKNGEDYGKLSEFGENPLEFDRSGG